ncbi:NAD-binding Rossmann fold oxidoreductase family protein [Stipitochalara longipes BDJ]|nr:NAD-binding Rossmann fold oxidoreductase family protein [Stipitochalara longipes BDJ]
MAPIRIGFLGLSKEGWAPRAHLPYLQSSPDYEIVAICNSSVASSEEAIKLYSLPSTTKAYGDPEELAKDPNVDLVVCSVRVDRHLGTIGPSLKAGKDVYVEWPLGKSLVDAKELLKLKNEGGVKKAVVGLQARQAPIIKKLKELIEGGKIGEVYSSTWVGQGSVGGESTGLSYEYLSRKEVGGNMVTIHFGHAIDFVQAVLGYGFQGQPKSVLANRRKFQKLLGNDGKVIEEKREKTTVDTVFLDGTLSSGIPISFSLRGGKPFPGQPGMDWTIHGEKSTIRISSPSPFLQIGFDGMKIEVQDGEGEKVEEVEIGGDEFDGYGHPARNVGRVYKVFTKGEINCSFEDAVERHALIEALYRENGIQE